MPTDIHVVLIQGRSNKKYGSFICFVVIARFSTILLFFCIAALLPEAVQGQFTSKDNYTGLFSDNYSWEGGTAPNSSNVNSFTTINGFITSNSSLTIAKKTSFTVHDTLIIYGNLNISLDANFNIEAGAICIVYGNVDAENKVELAFGSHFVVTGNFKATGNSTVDINPGAAVYILGEVDVVNMPELKCDNTSCKPEEYVPPGDNCCARGDIISMEDNENDEGGIYDFFVEGDALNGITPVYTELCGSETVTISAVFTNGTNYQWRDSIGNAVINETGVSLTTNLAGEYFATFEYNGNTITTHRAKVVVSTGSINANYTYSDESCPGESDGSIVFSNPTGGGSSYEYSVIGGTNWYTNATFSNLSAGIYNLVIRETGSSCITVLDDNLVLGSYDNEAPDITCQPNVIVTAAANQCYAMVNLVSPQVSDNCSEVINHIVSNDGPSDSKYFIGTTNVTWTVEDEAGNTSTCVQQVTVNQNETIDIEVSDLGNSCQNGETGSLTTISWDLIKLRGTTNWSFDYTIEEPGNGIIDSGTGINASGNTILNFNMENETSTDKTFTLTIFNVRDNCGVAELNELNNADNITMYGLPNISEITSK